MQTTPPVKTATAFRELFATAQLKVKKLKK